ncbi:hypothetical protein [Cognatishimia sp.]|uniref:hypothetical protein n=1 Tax=Cognatishimia sp. TaxID=2211648 RepID=UPI003512565C
MKPKRDATNVNHARLKTLAQNLEIGAPGVAFCLGAPLSTIEQGIGPDADPFDIEPIRLERDKKGLTPKDLACGIDGYALFLFTNPLVLYSDPFCDPFAQEQLISAACEVLGLPCTNSDFGHPLFNAPIMPFDASPQIASLAVRRVLDGQDPW